jgi:hypothetical protein
MRSGNKDVALIRDVHSDDENRIEFQKNLTRIETYRNI